jgi:hypothetical protein
VCTHGIGDTFARMASTDSETVAAPPVVSAWTPLGSRCSAGSGRCGSPRTSACG